VEEVDARAGRPVGLTESLVCQWELGNVRPSMRYRSLLAEVFKPEKIDFEQAERTSNRGLRLITTHDDLTGALERIVRGAENILAIVGSRSREPIYLEEIENVLSSKLGLIHYRLLFGPPRHKLFQEHLLRMLEMCDPQDRSVAGVQRLNIGLAPDGYVEVGMCVSEKEGVVILPSLVSPGNFDTALSLSSPEHSRGLISHVQQLYHGSEKVETAEAVNRLGVEELPPSCL
jgi:hypothetical protein